MFSPEIGKAQGVPLVVPPPAQVRPDIWLLGLDLGMVNAPAALALLSESVQLGGPAIVQTELLTQAADPKPEDAPAHAQRRSHYPVGHLQRWIGVNFLTIARAGAIRPTRATPRA